MGPSSGVVAVALLIFGCAASQAAHAQAPQPTGVIFENVRIFDGTSDRLSAPSNVLVVGNVIKAISSAPIADPPATSVTRLQGGGRTLMPGLIDAHTHIMFETVSQAARAHQRHRFHQRRCREGRKRHVDARLHQHPRPGRPGLRAEARHRPGAGARASDLAVGGLHLAERRPRRLPLAERPPGASGRLHLQRADWRRGDRRQSRCRALAGRASNSRWGRLRSS